MESLEDVKLIGFGGADEDMDLVRLLFASSKNSIKSMTLEEVTNTTGLFEFAECPKHSAKYRKHSANYSSSVTLGE